MAHRADLSRKVLSAAILLPAALAVAYAPARASEDGDSTSVRALQALPIEDEEVQLDGQLTEQAWASADVTNGFTQRDPDDGSPATERTDVRVLYSGGAIYVGIRAFDSEPDKIYAQLVRRDSRSESDELTVYFDSFHDRRTAFAFSVNARGATRDVYYFNDSRRSDATWDPVWQVKTAVDDEGWTAEFRIPLTQLRFNRENTTWGLQVERRIQRKSEVVYWSPYSKEASGFASLFGTLNGLYRLSSPMRLELRPYTAVNNQRRPSSSGIFYAPTNEANFNAGFDLQYGITTDYTLDLTVNPDFGQVEADPAVVNLSVFETFFPERRPFFVEGAALFNQWIPGGRLFYSRRIGRRPQGFGVPPEGGTIEIPDFTTIIAAGKVTGKSQAGLGLGILTAYTASEDAALRDSTGVVVGSAHVQPGTFHFAGRVEQDFSEGSNTIGGMFTAVNRNLSNNLDFLRSSAYVGMFDGTLRWSDNTYAVRWRIGASHVGGSQLALTGTQLSSVRYFQRPDAPHVELDTTRTSLSGYALALSANKEAGTWQYGAEYERASPGIEISDMGFQWWADRQFTGGWLRYLQAQPKWVFRSFRLQTNANSQWTTGGEHLETWIRPLFFSATFTNNWRMNLNPIAFGQGHLSVTALRGGPAIRSDLWHNSFGFIQTDTRKPLALALWASYGAVPANGGKWYHLGPELGFRPTPLLRGSLGLEYSWSRDAAQWVTRRTALDSTRYIFAEIEQNTLSLYTRLDWAFTPTLSLQFYAQPFVSSGSYSEYKEVTNNRAEEFEDRFRIYGEELTCGADLVCEVDLTGNGEADFSFVRPDFNVQQLNSTLVFRWEYRPGSVLFFAWQHGRSEFLQDGSFGGFGDMRRIFGSQAENAFLIKLNYWISF